MKSKKKIIITAFLTIFLVLIGFSLDIVNNRIEWKMAQDAISSGGFPYQIGLTSVTTIQCQPSCCSAAGCRCCVGGTLCATILTEPQCLAHSDVSGAPAGGMGSNALFLNTAIAQAGLSPGGQLIAGGMSPTLMDSGVLASAGGCSGCFADASFTDKIKQKFKYFIAIFRD